MKKLIVLMIVIGLFFYCYFLSREELMLVSNQYYYQTEGGPEEIVVLELLTYNIQRGIGLDGQLDLKRTASVIRESGADIVGLNEVDVGTGRSGFINQARYLAEALQMNYAYGPSIRHYVGGYGNTILSRYPIIDAENIMLPVLMGSEGENRSLLKARVELGKDRTINILLTHLSLNPEERREQIKWINQYLEELSEPYILMGDFNTEAREVLSYIQEDGRLVPLVADSKTYPAALPTKGIDLFFSDERVIVLEEYTIESSASDHLPLYLKISLLPG